MFKPVEDDKSPCESEATRKPESWTACSISLRFVDVCVCESLLFFRHWHILVHLDFLMIDYINDFGYDLNPPRCKWLWNEWWFVTRKGSIEPQRCIDFFTKWIYLELQNPLLTFLGSKNKRKHGNSAWPTTDTLCPFISKERQVFLDRLFAKNEDRCLQRLKTTLAL